MKIPYFKQDRSYTCGPASLQMVFAFYGNHQSEADLAKRLETESKEGTTHKKMIDLATENGFYVYVNNDSDFSEITYFLKEKKPIITHFTEPSGDESHYAVIVDINSDSEIILNDPWNGKRFSMSKSDFSKRWVDRKGKFNNWIMVISPGKINNGRQYLPKT